MGNVWQMLGPIAHFRENSTYYSGKPPVRMTGALPQITIMMPVYKVSHDAVVSLLHVWLTLVLSRRNLTDRRDWKVSSSQLWNRSKLRWAHTSAKVARSTL